MVIRVENLGDPKAVVQFEDGGIDVLQRREFDRGARRNLVQMGRKFGFDLVIINPDSGFFGGERGGEIKTDSSRRENPAKTLWARRSCICIKENLQKRALPFL